MTRTLNSRRLEQMWGSLRELAAAPGTPGRPAPPSRLGPRKLLRRHRGRAGGQRRQMEEIAAITSPGRFQAGPNRGRWARGR